MRDHERAYIGVPYWSTGVYFDLSIYQINRHLYVTYSVPSERIELKELI
jgi:hypothetical protein